MVALALVAAGVTAFVLVRSERRTDQLAEHQAQLEHACEGLLPVAELRPLVPSDSAGRAEEFGVLLDGRPSRALLDRTLAWGGGEDEWEPDARVRVRAVAALPGEEDELAPGDLDETVGTWPAPPGGRGDLTYDSTPHGGSVTAWLRLDCPGGLSSRVRTSHDLRVRVDHPVRADYESDLTPRERLVPARTAVRVANWIASARDCASPRWPSPDKVVEK
ncbi:hypothetical protein [Streptomyces buecherae]|uniref:hypothetical protein n=1 Tax=Streptomyces buecherae TaxID=2763006 RepID=UPI00368E3CA9